MAKAETIWVKPANPRAPVILWEPDTDHPRNEAFIAGDAMAMSLNDIPAVEVGRTGAVDKLLRDGIIVQVQPTAADRELAKNTPPFPTGALDFTPPPLEAEEPDKAKSKG